MPELIYDLTVTDQLIYAAGNVKVVADSRNILKARYVMSLFCLWRGFIQPRE